MDFSRNNFQLQQGSPRVASELNLDYLKEVSGGDVEFEREILATFVEAAPELMESLEIAINEGDAAAVRHAAHTLKGSSRSIGGQGFAKVCETIEFAAKRQDLETCAAHLAEAQQAYERLKVACDAFCDDSSAYDQAA